MPFGLAPNCWNVVPSTFLWSHETSLQSGVKPTCREQHSTDAVDPERTLVDSPPVTSGEPRRLLSFTLRIHLVVPAGRTTMKTLGICIVALAALSISAAAVSAQTK